MRRIDHPGRASDDRLELVASSGRAVTVTLQGGIPLADAIAAAMEGLDAKSGWLQFENADVETLTYVAPAAAPNEDTVAWYSEPHRFDAGGSIDRLGMIVGQHQGRSFLHGHGLWRQSSGPQCMGHILADETVLARDTPARGFVLSDALFDRLHDEETNFDLFRPVGSEVATNAGFAALRVAPNIDLADALSQACARLGWEASEAYGVGSTIDVNLEDHAPFEYFETEFLLDRTICRASSAEETEVDMSIVSRDSTKPIQGRLVSGDNPVLITAEILLVRAEA